MAREHPITLSPQQRIRPHTVAHIQRDYNIQCNPEGQVFPGIVTQGIIITENGECSQNSEREIICNENSERKIRKRQERCTGIPLTPPPPLFTLYSYIQAFIVVHSSLAQFSLNNVNKRDLKHHHFISFRSFITDIM